MGITLSFFLIALLVQLRITKFIPVAYWIVIIATTTVGTEISDFIDRSLHLGYSWGSLLLSSCLGLTLFLWNKKYSTLEVYPITSRTKELYYWMAILFSNSLGTAFGDYLSDIVGLPYIHGALVTAFVILIVLLFHYFTRSNHIVLFWIAFVFTRPFGATFGDFLTKPLASGGLALDTLMASLISMVLIALLIALSTHSYKREVE